VPGVAYDDVSSEHLLELRAMSLRHVISALVVVLSWGLLLVYRLGW